MKSISFNEIKLNSSKDFHFIFSIHDMFQHTKASSEALMKPLSGKAYNENL